jgi:hypothetical protein
MFAAALIIPHTCTCTCHTGASHLAVWPTSPTLRVPRLHTTTTLRVIFRAWGTRSLVVISTSSMAAAQTWRHLVVSLGRYLRSPPPPPRTRTRTRTWLRTHVHACVAAHTCAQPDAQLHCTAVALRDQIAMS